MLYVRETLISKDSHACDGTGSVYCKGVLPNTRAPAMVTMTAAFNSRTTTGTVNQHCMLYSHLCDLVQYRESLTLRNMGMSDRV